jgi:CBS domain-containing protein
MPQKNQKSGAGHTCGKGAREAGEHMTRKEGSVVRYAEKNIITTQPLNSVKNVAKLMKKHDFRRIPVTDAGTGRLEGLATAMDILDFLGGGEKYNIIEKDYKGKLPAAINCPIKKIMRPANYLTKNSTVKEMAKLIIDKHRSAFPIVEDEKTKKVIGIITERDILPQSDCYGITVEEVMKTCPIISTPGMMISDVSKIMVRNGFRRLPVIKEDKLIGVVTVFDILEFIGYGEYSHVDAEEALSERVEKIMSRDVITVTQDQDLGYLAGLVESTGLGGFPVVVKNKLLGIVTISDMIKAVYH